MPPVNRLPPLPPPDDQPGNKPLGGCLRQEDETGFHPGPTPAPPPSFCWCCDKQILSKADGRNLEDETANVFHVHHACWDQFPAGEKVRIRILLRQQEIGANLTQVIGETRNAIMAFESLVRLAMREYTHRLPEDLGEGQN